MNIAKAGEELMLQLIDCLKESGFRHQPNGQWVVEEFSLCMLDKSEYVRLRRV
jgi:hypothetical protein